jgi:flagellar hook protein FlgE
VSTDVALSGNGFFVVKGSDQGITGDFYTRDGQFKIDNSGFLVNARGMQAQGYASLGNGQFASAVSSLKVPTSALAPNASAKMNFVANIDSGATVPVLPWDAQNPTATSNFSSSMTTYDSLGQSHNVDVYFRKTGANTWDYHVLAAGSEVNGGVPGQNSEIGNGTLAFTNAGALNTVTTTTPIAVSFNNAKPNQAVALNFGTSIASGGTGTDGVTQYAATSNISSQSQDGYSSGDLSGVSVDGNGVLSGIYTNGQKVAVGALGVAKFQANEGLGRAGQNLWIATTESGDAALGTAGAGGRGTVSAGSLELSNVDLADQFVQLIAHQRAFQANSKTITTADEMLQELVNLKR